MRFSGIKSNTQSQNLYLIDEKYMFEHNEQVLQQKSYVQNWLLPHWRNNKYLTHFGYHVRYPSPYFVVFNSAMPNLESIQCKKIIWRNIIYKFYFDKNNIDVSIVLIIFIRTLNPVRKISKLISFIHTVTKIVISQLFIIKLKITSNYFSQSW